MACRCAACSIAPLLGNRNRNTSVRITIHSFVSGGSTLIGYFFGTPRTWRASCTITKCITTRIESIVRSAARPPRYAPAYPLLLQPRLTVTRGGHIAAVCFRLRSRPDSYFATHRFGARWRIPLAVALASDFAPPMAQGRLVILMSAGVPVGFTIGGLLASQIVSVFGWPAIFVVGGVLPLTMMPLLALRLPESVALRAATRRRNLVAALFQNGLAPSTVLLWAINLLSLLGVYFILLWMPAILHSTGVSPSRAILGTTMYALGVIVSPLLAAPVVDRIGMERVLTCGLAFGALCVLSIGLFNPPLWLLTVLIGGAGIGGGC